MIKNRNIGKPFSAILIAAIMVLIAFSAMCTPASAATEAEIEQAIDDGLVWLVAQQENNGSWNAYYGSYEAGTGLALYKLCERAYELGYDSPFDPDYEYHQNVSDGFNWTFAHLNITEISPQNHTTGATGTVDNPDSNGNGLGVHTLPTLWLETYNTAILLTAISASDTPSRVVDVPGSDVDGWTYGQVAQDMVDYLAFGQVEDPVPGITKEGGWDYQAVDNGTGGTGWKGDQSNSGYAVLGLAEAEAFGCTVPNWVKTELNVWIDYVQDDVNGDSTDGGSWYSYPGDGIGVNILKTGNLIFEMAFVGDTPDTKRVINATDYLVREWGNASGWNQPPGWNGTPAQYHTMFTTMKGLEYMGIDTFDGIDWFEDFSDVIVAQQNKTPGPTYGSWQDSSGRGEPVIITEWALLTLEKIAPPPLVIIEKDFRYTSVDFVPMLWVDDTPDIPDDNVGHWEQQPAILGGLLPKDIVDPDPDFYDVRYVLKSKKGIVSVSSTNPGQLYGVINITGVGVTNVSITDTFGIPGDQFDVNPAQLGGGVEVIRVNATGYATVLTNTTQVTATVDNVGNQVTVDINLTSPLVANEHLMVYVKFKTALKGLAPPEICLDYMDFVNSAEVIVDEREPILAEATIEFYS